MDRYSGQDEDFQFWKATSFESYKYTNEYFNNKKKRSSESVVKLMVISLKRWSTGSRAASIIITPYKISS